MRHKNCTREEQPLKSLQRLERSLAYSIKRQSCNHIETNQLTYRANQLLSFYMMATLAFNELMY